MFELEGEIIHESIVFNFLNRSISLFLKGETILKPKEQKLIKIEAQFLDEISGLAIIKLLDRST